MKFLFSLIMLIIFASCTNAPQSTGDHNLSRSAALDFSDGVVIDVRTAEEQAEGYVDGAILADVTNGDFERMLPTLDKDENYYLYCRTGNRSGKAREIMLKNGFDNVENIGGYNDLKSNGVKVKE